jgi:hypothetical protein
MEESSTYQAIIAEGAAKGAAGEARRFLLLLGRKRFGAPDEQTRSALEAITDLKRLEQLGERLLDVESWEELLALPRARRTNAKRRRP